MCLDLDEVDYGGIEFGFIATNLKSIESKLPSNLPASFHLKNLLVTYQHRS